MMNITILNGALPGDDFVDNLQDVLAEQLAARGHHVCAWTLREEKIAYCLGCFECWTKYPGLCRINDTGRDVSASMINGDLTVYLTPVMFGGYSSELKKALDRSIGLIMPFFTRVNGEVHHKPRYQRYPRLLGLGVLPAPDPEQERLFSTLVERNAINLHAPTSEVGFLYRGMGHSDVLDRLEKVCEKAGLAKPDLVMETQR